MDFEPDEAALKPWIEQGVSFVKDRVTPENLGSMLGRYLSASDLLIDLAWNIDCCEIVQWCHDRGALCVNTSVELWDPYAGADDKHSFFGLELIVRGRSEVEMFPERQEHA